MPVKICKGCWSVLDKQEDTFCSKECFMWHAKTERLKQCKKCGRWFDGGLNVSYCCRKCFLNRHLRRAKNGTVWKKCNRCKKEKPNDFYYYYKNKNCSNGFSGTCKVCCSKESKSKKAREHQQNSRRKHREKTLKREKKYNQQAHIKARRRRKELARRKTDPHFVLKNRMRCLMWMGLKKEKGGRKWQDIAGYSVKTLKIHLEKLFTPGMTWEKLMNGEIHIDHKLPVSSFNFTTTDDSDFKKCWAIDNLQPLWAKDNLKKGAKIL